ncbi:MAG TPA: winged helix-turn-helix domain-containing protein, partial [Gammaproteobacteria bacterium]|nr:winged helix-turn-helix domain-containing protein [Gammaproteobacteria bacterium]
MDPIRTGSDHRYAFGAFVFNPASGELREGAKTTQLRPQVAKLLELLLGNPDNVVTREEIRHTLWDEKVVVEFEEGISACVRQLRVALNDGVAGVRYVQTIARRGYKFVAPVQILPPHGQVADSTTQPRPTEPFSHGEPSEIRHVSHGRLALAVGLIAILLGAVVGGYFYMLKSPVPPPTADGQRAVIAVLPFDNLSPNAHNALLGASVSNDLIDLLGPIAPKRLGVIAYTS